MHEDVESISALERCLVVYRRTLEFLEIQRAQFGAFTPLYIWHQFDETRGEIARVKRELRAQGVEVADQPADAGAPTATAPPPVTLAHEGALLLTYQRMLLDQVRYVSLAGMCDWADLHPQLAALYVERALTPLDSGAPAEHATHTGTARALFDLACAPGARMLLEGEPGSGKTTCLRMLAWDCLTQATAASAPSAAAWPGMLPLPILLSGSDIALALTRANAAPNDRAMPTLSAFWEAIEAWLQFSNLKQLVPTIQQKLERGECFVLIDDMDDLPFSASLPAFMAALGRFVARYPDNRYLVTCDTFQPGAMAPLASFARYTLAPPEPAQTAALIRRWYGSVADRAGLLVAEAVERRAEQIQAVVQGDPRLQALTRTPLGLALCVLAHAQGHPLPAARGVVLRRLADLLINGRAFAGLGSARQLGQPLDLAQHTSVDQRRALVEPLALALQSRLLPDGEGAPELSAAEAAGLIGDALRRVDDRAADAITAELLSWCSTHQLLRHTTRDTYSMPNVPVREYLAGRALASLPDFPSRAYALRHTPHWREPILHAVGELGQRCAPHVARLFVRLLLHPPAAGPAQSAAGAQLAAECLIALGERSWPDRALRDEVRNQLLACVGQAALALADRVRAGLLLGSLSDPRFASILPLLAKVPAGPFTLGSAEGYDDEGPAQSVDLPEYAIGVFLVTNQEYARFLAEHPQQPRPHYWYDPRFNNPATPVVGVTWHDAAAYCEWLTARLRAANMITGDQVVRLPSELEWEKAASWDAGRQVKRRFPWGDTWSSERANTAEDRGFWTATPVGCYPGGVSAYGLHDCVGNVWEWTSSCYASYPGAARPFCEQGAYTLRGSSWATNPTHARCTYRSRLPPGYWRNHLGFRVVVARA